MMSMLSRSSRSSTLTGTPGPCALSPATSLYARSLMALDAALGHRRTGVCCPCASRLWVLWVAS